MAYVVVKFSKGTNSHADSILCRGSKFRTDHNWNKDPRYFQDVATAKAVATHHKAVAIMVENPA